ncbi:MAG TPA: hypothetical protein VFT23_11885, partial [Burkholderiales bacterium]|nr:hypothetical protein [Burkholderiales bacterium]
MSPSPDDTRLRALWVLLLAALIASVAPLIGLAASGNPIAPYLAFPPRAVPAAHAPASWLWFGLLSLPAIVALGLIVLA